MKTPHVYALLLETGAPRDSLAPAIGGLLHVTRSTTCQQAIVQLRRFEFDAVICHCDSPTQEIAELLNWLGTHRPKTARLLVYDSTDTPEPVHLLGPVHLFPSHPRPDLAVSEFLLHNVHPVRRVVSLSPATEVVEFTKRRSPVR